jgi:WD40 repeat protein
MKIILTSKFTTILLFSFILIRQFSAQHDVHIVQIKKGDQYLSNSTDGNYLYQWNGLTQNVEFHYEGLESPPIKFFYRNKQVIALDSNEILIWDEYTKSPKERYELPKDISRHLKSLYGLTDSYRDFWQKVELQNDFLYIGIAKLLVEVSFKEGTYKVQHEFEDFVSGLTYSEKGSYLLIEENLFPKRIHQFDLNSGVVKKLTQGESISASVNINGSICIYNSFTNTGEIYSSDLRKASSFVINDYVGHSKPLFIGNSHLFFPFSDSSVYLYSIVDNYLSSLGFANGNGSISQLEGYFMSISNDQNEVSCQTIHQFLSSRQSFKENEIHNWKINQELNKGEIVGNNFRINDVNYQNRDRVSALNEFNSKVFVGLVDGTFATLSSDGKLSEIDKISHAVSSLLSKDSILYIGSLGRIVTYDLKKKAFGYSFRAHEAFVNRLSISPNGKFLLSVASDGSVFIWNIQEQSMIHRFFYQKSISTCSIKNDLTIQLLFSDGESLDEINSDLYNRLFSDNLEVRTRLLHSSSIVSIDHSKSGEYLISLDSEGVIKIWLTSQMIPIHTLQFDDGIKKLKFIENGTTFFAFSGTCIYIFDTKSGGLIRKLDIPSIYGEILILDVTAAKNGRFFLLSSVNSNEVYFYNLTSNSFGWFCSGPVPFSVKNIEYNPMIDSLFVSYGAEGIYVYESSKGQFLRKIKNVNNSNTNGYVNYTLRFSPDGKLLMAQFNDSIRVFNFEKGDLIATYKGYLGFFSSDSSVFISSYAAKDQLTRYFSENIYTKKKNFAFVLDRLDYLTNEFTYDQERNLVFVTKNSEIKIINLRSGQFFERSGGMPSEDVIAQFDPLNNNKLIVSIDKEIKTIDAITGAVDKVWKLRGDEITYNHDFSKIAINRSNDVFVYAVIDESFLYKVEDVNKVIFTGEGQLICFSYFKGIRILNEETGALIFSKGDLETKEMLKSYIYVPNDHELLLVIWKSISNSNKLSYTERIEAMKKGTYIVGIDAATGKEKYKRDFPTEFTEMAYSSKNQLAMQTGYRQFKLIKDKKELFINSDLYFNSIHFSDDGNYFYFTGSEGQLECYNTETAELLYRNRFHDKEIEMLSWKDSLMLTVGRDGKSVLLNAKNGNLIGSYLFFKGDDHVMIDANNYYKGSKKGVQGIYFKKGSNYYPIEQFDAQQNRPDKVLKSFGEKNQEVLASYEQAVEKRLSKMGIKSAANMNDFALPILQLKDPKQIPVISSTGQLSIDLFGKTSNDKLQSMHVWINDVPLHGINGLTAGIAGNISFETKYRLELAEGNNKLQFALMNSKGVESEKLTYFIFYEPVNPVKKNLYLINLGVSNYVDSTYNLSYASKDANDIKNTFLSYGSEMYDSVIHFSLIDKELTTQKVMDLKKHLLKARRNDVVLITFAGHGILDEKYNYFLATHDIDFNNPAIKGLAYENFEMLFDGIAPLKKSLFIDACHSGEVDMESVASMNTTNVVTKKVGRGGKAEYVVDIQKINTSELTKELFNDLRRGTGATVISASGGLDVAFESNKYQNGLFTYCLLHGLKDLAADKNQDGKIMLSELQEFLQKEVFLLSNGAQIPTSRIENLSLDFRVW